MNLVFLLKNELDLLNWDRKKGTSLSRAVPWGHVGGLGSR